MFTSTYSSSTSLFSKHNFPRRMLLHDSPLYHPISSPPPLDYQLYTASKTETSFDTNVVMIFSVLLCLLVFSICINCLIRCMFKCLIWISTQQEANNLHKEVIRSGVDKRALKTFPVVKYSKEVKIQGLSIECVICLSEFKEGERVRILPKCNHGFHVKCIDLWLKSHSSCPTCRQSLVDTCQKIIGCENDDGHHHHAISSSSASISTSASSSSREIIGISIVPLEREDFVRN